MRWLITCGMAAVIAMAGNVASADPPKTMPADNGVRIARWKGDKKAALSLTFDDGLVDQLEHALPILNEAGIRATFALITSTVAETKEEAKGKKSSWEEWKEVAKAGHEIANHSATHQRIPNLPRDKWDAEIATPRKEIEEKIGQPCVSFIEPFNFSTPEMRKKVLETHIVDAGADRLIYGIGKDAAYHNKMVDAAIQDGTWKIAMIHAIKNGYAAWASVDAFKQHVAYIREKQGVLWVDTLGTVAKYRRESEAAVLKVERAGKSATLSLTLPAGAGLDGKVFDEPLTVVVKTNAGVQKASATRGEDELMVTIRGEELLLDIRPGDAKVVVKWE